MYEGPLRLRLPVSIALDADGAFSFQAPLPSPSGNLGKVGRTHTCANPLLADSSANDLCLCLVQFMDSFKGLVVPSHLRPPAQAINWIVPTGDSGTRA